MVTESFFLGMDDIDSPTGGCTTHFASLLIERLEPLIDQWMDYPHLIRLNPNIPYRTRGNGAVCLKFFADSKEKDEILHLMSDMVGRYADLNYPNTNPGIVLFSGDLPPAVRSFSRKAVWRTVPLSLALRLIEKYQLSYLSYGNYRGLVGAIASIGHGLEEDHTYEYLAYRRMNETQNDRGVDMATVETMNEKTYGRTFSNLDSTDGSILIQPQGPDPVLYGIRGERPEDVIDAASYISCAQEVDRWIVMRTNQGTGEHLSHTLTIDKLRPYMSASLSAEVSVNPNVISGGHVLFRVSDNHSTIQCAAYEPTGDFRWEVMKLIAGDRVTLHVGVRPASSSYDLTLNVEGMIITHLVDKVEYTNPLCGKCGKRMKSAGRDKGYKCNSCGNIERKKSKEKRIMSRDLQLGYYLPCSSAQRHLTRPHIRLGKKNQFSGSMIEVWHSP